MKKIGHDTYDDFIAIVRLFSSAADVHERCFDWNKLDEINLHI